MASIEIANTTRRPTPRLSYEAIARALVPGWKISLVFVGPKKARDLNETLRNKPYVPNVLAYEVGAKSGEVIMCLSEAKKQAPSYNHSYTQFVTYLFIHALLHLKGYPHGPTMEKVERALMARFVSTSSHNNGAKNRNRNRHRHSSDESRRR